MCKHSGIPIGARVAISAADGQVIHPSCGGIITFSSIEGVYQGHFTNVMTYALFKLDNPYLCYHCGTYMDGITELCDEGGSFSVEVLQERLEEVMQNATVS